MDVTWRRGFYFFLVFEVVGRHWAPGLFSDSVHRGRVSSVFRVIELFSDVVAHIVVAVLANVVVCL